MDLIHSADELPEFNSFSISSFNATREEFSKKNRLIRYHYTSAEALINILSNNPKLRFTDNRFMNDHSEMVYCVKSLISFLSQNSSKYPFCQEVVKALLFKKHTEQEYLNLLVSKVDFEDNEVFPYKNTRSFLFCMSIDGDSLPMWNYYVHNGKYEGYNIGFDIYNFLKSFDTDKKDSADPVVFHYGKVLYSESDHFKELKRVADWIERDRMRKGSYAIPENMAFLRHYIETQGLFFKHESFRNEQEYRIVLSLTDNRVNATKDGYINDNVKNMKLMFCTRNGVFVPYMEMPINKDAIKTITVSPTVESNIAEIGIKEFLEKNGYTARIKRSNIPIRF